VEDTDQDPDRPAAAGRDAVRTPSLARAVHLSTAAVHERVRKLRRTGVIRRTTVEVDQAALGACSSPSWRSTPRGWVRQPLVDAVRDDPRVEDLHSIAGDTHFAAEVRVTGPADLEDLQHDLYRVEGVRSTRTHVALQTYVERLPCSSTHQPEPPVAPSRR
jgi:DNA-binding Lrp family transcriptional regulator